jgi:hypothetical protein
VVSYLFGLSRAVADLGVQNLHQMHGLIPGVVEGVVVGASALERHLGVEVFEGAV